MKEVSIRKKRKTKSKISRRMIRILIIIIAVIILIMFVKNKANKKEEVPTSIEKVETKKEDIGIKMTIVGDVMCHNTQYMDAYDEASKKYNFSYVFDEIKEKLAKADFTVGNLETTFTGSEIGYSGYPTFNTPEALAKNLKAVGFDLVSTANNHSLDKRYKGIESTIKHLDEAELLHTGTYTSEESQNKTVIQDIKGIKTAFLSYTYGTNGIPVPTGKEYSINLIDKDLIKKQINKAKESGAELICVSMHWGVEYNLKQNNEQKELADFLFNNGVDIILGSHPHVLQPMEKRTIELDGKTKEVFVIYSLGNFISGQVAENTKNSIILDLDIKKTGDGQIKIEKIEYTPIYMYKGSSNKQKFKVLDIEKSIMEYENGTNKKIGEATYNTLKIELNKIKKMYD